MRKEWRVETKNGLSIAYFHFFMLAAKVFFASFVLFKITEAKGWSIYWMYLFIVIMLLYAISRVREFAAYQFVIDSVKNILIISGINMLKQKKREIVQLTGMDTEFLKIMRWNGVTDEEFTLTLKKDDKVVIKIKEGYYNWSEEQLRGIHDYIQERKAGV